MRRAIDDDTADIPCIFPCYRKLPGREGFAPDWLLRHIPSYGSLSVLVSASSRNMPDLSATFRHEASSCRSRRRIACGQRADHGAIVFYASFFGTTTASMRCAFCVNTRRRCVCAQLPHSECPRASRRIMRDGITRFRAALVGLPSRGVAGSHWPGVWR